MTSIRTPLAAAPLAAAALALTLCATAGASTLHTVTAGQTLWSIAAANGVSPAALAAANGLSPDAHVVTGTNLQIPAASAAGESVPGSEAGEGSAASPQPPALGAYTVRPGDTLSAIAARAGVPASEIAWMNGLRVSGPLLTGTALKLPTGAPNAAATPAVAASRIPTAAPYPSGGFASSSQIGSIAATNGVPPSLAKAVAWQESGFNNGAVSSANARGVMQVMPGTWSWVQRNLSSTPLDPTSVSDNIRAGTLYLGNLLRQTGSESAAVAAYYQGLGSIRAIGLLPDTRRYVNDVMSLTGHFGG